MSEGFSSSHPDQLKALKMNNPQFRKQAKVNFHANCSVTILECSAYRVNSAVPYSQEGKTRNSSPTSEPCDTALERVPLLKAGLSFLPSFSMVNNSTHLF